MDYHEEEGGNVHFGGGKTTDPGAGDFNDALSLDLVLREVLTQLSFTDLLGCSLVSKHWQYWSRSALRETQECYLRTPLSAADFLELENCIKSGEQLPYNGLNLKSRAGGILKECGAQILLKSKLKHLKIYGSFEDLREVIEIIKPSDPSESLREAEQRNLFSCREFLQLRTITLYSSVGPAFLQGLLETLPNLQELNGNIRGEGLGHLVSENKMGLIKEFFFTIDSSGLQDQRQFTKFGMLRPKLRGVTARFDNYLGNREEFVNFWKILTSLLISSARTLETLRIDQLSLFWLQRMKGLPRLSRVRRLEFGYDEDLDLVLGFCTLATVDLGRLFPGLREVIIRREYSCYLGLRKRLLMNNYFLDKFRQINHNSPMPCPNATKLWLLRSKLPPSLWQSLARVFPNVRIQT